MLRLLAKMILALLVLLFGVLLVIVALGMVGALVAPAIVGPAALPFLQQEVLGLQYRAGFPVTTIQLFAMLTSAFVVLGFLFCLALIAWRLMKGAAPRSAEKLDADESRMMQEIYQGLFGLEERVEALETILLAGSRKRAAGAGSGPQQRQNAE